MIWLLSVSMLYHENAGCFDVTIHSADYNQDTIQSVVFNITSEEQSSFFRQPGITINLSGFLKGYALEKTGTLLQHYEVKDALINMGNSSVLAFWASSLG